mgnify:CR=1 FL=1
MENIKETRIDSYTNQNEKNDSQVQSPYIYRMDDYENPLTAFYSVKEYRKIIMHYASTLNQNQKSARYHLEKMLEIYLPDFNGKIDPIDSIDESNVNYYMACKQSDRSQKVKYLKLSIKLNPNNCKSYIKIAELVDNQTAIKVLRSYKGKDSAQLNFKLGLLTNNHQLIEDAASNGCIDAGVHLVSFCGKSYNDILNSLKGEKLEAIVFFKAMSGQNVEDEEIDEEEIEEMRRINESK